MLDILHTCCRDPRVKVPTVNLPAEENFPNNASDSIVQYFIYLISRPTGDMNGGQFLLLKLAIYQRAI